MLPAFLMVAPLVAASEPRRQTEYLRNERLAKYFDAGKVAFGDSRAKVEAAFGQPLRAIESGRKMVCGYGNAEPLNMVAVSYLFSPIDVHFDADRVVGVFGNDFVNTVDGVRPKQ